MTTTFLCFRSGVAVVWNTRQRFRATNWRLRDVLTQLDALVVRVEQEGAEAVGHVVVGQELQVVLTELKLHGELEVDLRVEGHRNTGYGLKSPNYSPNRDADMVYAPCVCIHGCVRTCCYFHTAQAELSRNNTVICNKSSDVTDRAK